MTTLIPKVDLQNGGTTPTGAVNRPINEKLSDFPSILDFGTNPANNITNYVAAYPNLGLFGSGIPNISPTGTNNFGIGPATFNSLTNGSNNLAIGFTALSQTTGGAVPAPGTQSGYGCENIAIGNKALQFNIDGYNNLALGNETLNFATNGHENVAIGHRSLRLCTTGFQNTAIGAVSIADLTTGYANTFLGYGGGEFLTTGFNNIGIGCTPLNTATNPYDCVAIGNFSQYYLTTGYRNISIGTETLNVVSSGNSNIAIGFQSMFASTTALSCSAVGHQTLVSNITGNGHTAFGYFAMGGQTTGLNSTGIGFAALSTTNYSNSTALGANSEVTGNNQVQLGDGNTTTYAYGAVQNRSDIRDKTDVRDTVLGLNFINGLRPVDFKWDMRDSYKPVMPVQPSDEATDEEKEAYKTAIVKWKQDCKLSNITKDGSKKRNRYHHGLIAQEVKAVADVLGIDFGGYQDHSIAGGDDVLSIGYEELIAPMIKAIQELKAEIDVLKAK